MSNLNKERQKRKWQKKNNKRNWNKIDRHILCGRTVFWYTKEDTVAQKTHVPTMCRPGHRC